MARVNIKARILQCYLHSLFPLPTPKLHSLSISLFQWYPVPFFGVPAVSHCGMTAPCPEPEAQMDPPSPTAYGVTLIEYQVFMVKQVAIDFAHTSMYS